MRGVIIDKRLINQVSFPEMGLKTDLKNLDFVRYDDAGLLAFLI